MSAPLAGGLTFEEYTARQAAIVAALVQVLIVVLAPFRVIRLSGALWRAVLAALYPHIAHARTRSAQLARAYYDAERNRHVAGPLSGEGSGPIGDIGTPGGGNSAGSPRRHPIDLPGYAPGWLAESLESLRPRFSVPDAPNAALAQVVSIAAKHAEDAGRKTVLRAVRTDREAIGWARVAGGGESCAFCLMLISRGPVYRSAATAGLDTDDTTATAVAGDWLSSGDSAFMDALIDRWHPNCDCKVVPVFDSSTWPGRDGFLSAQRLWAQVTKGHSGTDALNALRRALYAGMADEASPLPAAA